MWAFAWLGARSRWLLVESGCYVFFSFYLSFVALLPNQQGARGSGWTVRTATSILQTNATGRWTRCTVLRYLPVVLMPKASGVRSDGHAVQDEDLRLPSTIVRAIDRGRFARLFTSAHLVVSRRKARWSLSRALEGVSFESLERWDAPQRSSHLEPIATINWSRKSRGYAYVH